MDTLIFIVIVAALTACIYLLIAGFAEWLIDKVWHSFQEPSERSGEHHE